MRSVTTKLTAMVAVLFLVLVLPAVAQAQGTLFVEGDKVGIGISSPTAPLHVSASKGEARIESTGSTGAEHASLILATTGGTTNTFFDIRANATTGALEVKEPLGSGAALKFRPGAANNSFVVGPAQGGFARVGIGTTTPQGPAGSNALDVNGAIFQRGSQLHADYVFEPDYKLASIEDHALFMWENKHLPGVPGRQVDAEGREVVEIGAQTRGIVEELEKAHIYIEQLHEMMVELQQSNRELQERVAKLQASSN